MNKAFQKVVATYKVPPKLTHTQEIMRLYRRCLRTINSWAEDRDLFNDEATKVRERFNANKSLPPDSAKTVRIIREAREELAAQTHPDPYIAPYMPGGSLFMRNPGIPLEALYPDGIPAHLSNRKVNIDMSNLDEGQQYANRVFVDSANKLYWIDK